MNIYSLEDKRNLQVEVPPKIHHFWWKVLHNAMATKEILFSRKCDSFPIFPLSEWKFFSVVLGPLKFSRVVRFWVG